MRKKLLANGLLIGLLSGVLVFGKKDYLNYVKEDKDSLSTKITELYPIKEIPYSELEKKIEVFINEKREQNFLYTDEKTAWSVYDLSTREKLVSINEDIPMQCASMMKPFVALAFYQLEKEGKLIYDLETKKEMEKMIQKSNNKSANLIMKKVGGPRKVQRILTDNYPEIFQHTKIKEYIPRWGKTYRNKASASDYTRFLHALWNDEIPQSKEIKRLMNLPNGDRIYRGVKNIPEGTRVYDKTGTTSHLVGDMGILYVKSEDDKRKPYVIVGIIEKNKRLKTADETKEWWASRGNIIRGVSGIVYDEMVKGN